MVILGGCVNALELYAQLPAICLTLPTYQLDAQLRVICLALSTSQLTLGLIDFFSITKHKRNSKFHLSLFTYDKIYLTVLRFKFKQGLQLTII